MTQNKRLLPACPGRTARQRTGNSLSCAICCPGTFFDSRSPVVRHPCCPHSRTLDPGCAAGGCRSGRLSPRLCRVRPVLLCFLVPTGCSVDVLHTHTHTHAPLKPVCLHTRACAPPTASVPFIRDAHLPRPTLSARSLWWAAAFGLSWSPGVQDLIGANSWQCSLLLGPCRLHFPQLHLVGCLINHCQQCAKTHPQSTAAKTKAEARQKKMCLFSELPTALSPPLALTNRRPEFSV